MFTGVDEFIMFTGVDEFIMFTGVDEFEDASVEGYGYNIR